jgi:transcriptional regulator with XRE-family HTH domain
MKFDLKKLKTLRKSAGYTQTQVAEVIGLQRTGYTVKEQGKVPISIEELCAIAEFLDADPSEFFIFDDDENHHNPKSTEGRIKERRGRAKSEDRLYSKAETEKMLDRYEKLIESYVHMIDTYRDRIEELESFISANAKRTRKGDKQNIDVAELRKNPRIA